MVQISRCDTKYGSACHALSTKLKLGNLHCTYHCDDDNLTAPVIPCSLHQLCTQAKLGLAVHVQWQSLPQLINLAPPCSVQAISLQTNQSIQHAVHLSSRALVWRLHQQASWQILAAAPAAVMARPADSAALLLLLLLPGGCRVSAAASLAAPSREHSPWSSGPYSSSSSSNSSMAAAGQPLAVCNRSSKVKLANYQQLIQCMPLYLALVLSQRVQTCSCASHPPVCVV
jgi:hypothetical protein